MKPPRPCAGIHYAPKKKVFLVFTMGVGPMGQTLIDVPVEIADQEFDARIEAVLMEALNSYQTKVGADRVWHEPQGMGFIRKHLYVRIERLESGDLDVHPLHHMSGGYVGKEGEHIIVPAADIPAKIVSVLRDAFAVAT